MWSLQTLQHTQMSPVESEIVMFVVLKVAACLQFEELIQKFVNQVYVRIIIIWY